jgi:tetratricopeptide (TPR) repeat protein
VLLPILIATIAEVASAELRALATASGRPSECTATKSAHATVWTLAREPKITRYCQLIARAHARLPSETKSALASANAAEELLPGRAPAQVAIARAALKLGRLDDALGAFARALERDRRSVDSPLALHDLASAQRQAGRLGDAVASYRQLVPLVKLLPAGRDRARVLLEAAHTSMAIERERDKPNLDEALAYLREARRDRHHAYELDLALSLVLTLDRAGKREQADALLAELPQVASWATFEQLSYLAAPADREALRALALEASAPEAAAASYRVFLAQAGAQGPWHARAQERLDRLKTGRRGPRSR